MIEQPEFENEELRKKRIKKKETSIIARHSLKPTIEDPEAEGYPGLSKKGVELARQKANEFLSLIEQSEEGSVIVFSGVSDLPRTRSTLKIYAEETVDQLKEKEKGETAIFSYPMKKVSSGSEKEKIKYLVFSEESLASIKKQEGKLNFREVVGEINQTLKDNPQARLIALFPLRIKQFHDKSWDSWDENTKEYKLGEYADNRIDLFKKDKINFMRKWIEDKGIIEGQQIGPDPEVVARNYELAIKRMNHFIGNIFPENKGIINFMVAHEYELDAFITSLIEDKKITEDNFDDIRQGGETINETEIVRIEECDNSSTLIYREKRFNI